MTTSAWGRSAGDCSSGRPTDTGRLTGSLTCSRALVALLAAVVARPAFALHSPCLRVEHQHSAPAIRRSLCGCPRSHRAGRALACNMAPRKGAAVGDQESHAAARGSAAAHLGSAHGLLGNWQAYVASAAAVFLARGQLLTARWTTSTDSSPEIRPVALDSEVTHCRGERESRGDQSPQHERLRNGPFFSE